MAPNVPPTRGYPGPMPPHGAPPPRPARRDGRTLPLVLIAVLGALLIFAVVTRLLPSAGGKSASDDSSPRLPDGIVCAGPRR